jgi:hypothetical protein
MVGCGPFLLAILNSRCGNFANRSETRSISRQSWLAVAGHFRSISGADRYPDATLKNGPEDASFAFTFWACPSPYRPATNVTFRHRTQRSTSSPSLRCWLFFSRAISEPLTPAFPPFNWTSRRSSSSAFPLPRRYAIASMMPVRGDPVAPSKNATFHPCWPQYWRKASLLAASDARTFANELIARRVRQARRAESLLFVRGFECTRRGLS